jgi:hypothetical protein
MARPAIMLLGAITKPKPKESTLEESTPDAVRDAPLQAWKNTGL